jgi:hypothetical protein
VRRARRGPAEARPVERDDLHRAAVEAVEVQTVHAF